MQIQRTFAGLLLAAVCFVAAPVVAQKADTPACPTGRGAYYRVEDDWKMMDKVQAAGFRGPGGGALLPGATMKVKGEFRDTRSPYQLAAGKLSICLVGVIDSGRDITVVKMQEQKDHRELQISSARAFSTANGAQYDKKAVVPVETQKLADGVYIVTSSQPLADGEFILLTQVPDVFAILKANTAGALAGYDFGSHPK